MLTAESKKTIIPVFIVNLEHDLQRRQDMLDQFRVLSGFAPKMIKAVNGRTLPHSVCRSLVADDVWADRKGTIGCFISHVSAWEMISKTSSPYGIVLEDDTDLLGLGLVNDLILPEDADIVFLNERMSLGHVDEELHIVPILELLRMRENLTGGLGGDGYLLTPSAARKLVTACVKDLYYGHVDGRLLRYATSECDLETLPESSIISHVVRHHHNPLLLPRMGLLKGYTVSRYIVRHRGLASSREIADTVGSKPIRDHPSSS